MKKFELKTEPEVMLLKGGEKLKFILNLELANEIPEGSYLGVEAYALKPSNLGTVPCFPIAVSSVLNTIIFHFCFQILNEC